MLTKGAIAKFTQMYFTQEFKAGKGHRLWMWLIVLLLVALPSYVHASCNPLQDSSCLVQNPGLKSPFAHIFTCPSVQFEAHTTPAGVEYCDQGLKLTLRQRLDNPSLVSKFSILHGKVEVELKAARGQGVVSSCYLQSDDEDEIDIVEVFGGDPYEFQSNFFVKGNTTNYDRGGYHATPASPMEVYLVYGVEWTPDNLTWFLNGTPVRVVKRNNDHGYPTSPMQVKFSLWAGGDPENDPGTIKWAGGLTNYTETPFSMYVRRLYVEDYSNGRNYVYGNGPNGWIDLEPAKPIGVRIKSIDTSRSSNTVKRSNTLNSSKFPKSSRDFQRSKKTANPRASQSPYASPDLRDRVRSRLSRFAPTKDRPFPSASPTGALAPQAASSSGPIAQGHAHGAEESASSSQYSTISKASGGSAGQKNPGHQSPQAAPPSQYGPHDFYQIIPSVAARAAPSLLLLVMMISSC